jgi:hypothetical protein
MSPWNSTEDDAWAALEHSETVNHGVSMEIAPDVDLHLSRAGHILGADADIRREVTNGPSPFDLRVVTDSCVSSRAAPRCRSP